MEALINTPVEQLTDTQLGDVTTHFNLSYRAGNPLIPDDVFDFVYMAALEIRVPDHPLLSGVQPEPEINSKGLITHPVKMLSTDKAYSTHSVQKWLDRVIKIGARIGLSPSQIIIEASSKLDGIAGRLVAKTKQLVTRGKTGEAGNDVSHLIENGLNIVGDGNADGVGEAVMKNKYFDAYSKETLGEDGFVDSRALISGAANSDNLKPVALKALTAGHVDLVIYKDMERTICTADKFMSQYEELEEKHLQSEYMLDGVIFDVANIELQEALGVTSHHPVWRLAKKKVKGAKPVVPHFLRWQVGRTRAITPVIEIEPTILTRKSVTSITGHSLGFLKKHGLGVGSSFLAHLAGDVIPSFLESIQRVTPDYPNNCPCCESPTEIRIGKDKDGDDCEHLMCSNLKCGGSNVSYLFHAFKRLNIDEFGKVSCETLVEHGFTTLEQIFGMTEADYETIGFGPVQSLNFLKEISRGKKDRLKDSHLLASIGIHLLGRGTSEKLLKQYKITELDSLTYDKLFAIKGFADITTKTVINGLLEKRETLEFLLAQGFNLSHTSEIDEVTDKDNKLAGLNIMFTGTMVQGNRNDMKADAKSKGAKVQSSLNGKTQILVIGEKASENKKATAKELGVEIINEQTYIDRYTSK